MSLFGCCGHVNGAPRYPYLSRPLVLTAGVRGMPIESDGHSKDNPRLYELIENAPKTGKSPTVWAWPQLIDYLKIAGQPVPGPWPPHQEPRPDPDYESLPVAVADPEARREQESS